MFKWVVKYNKFKTIVYHFFKLILNLKYNIYFILENCQILSWVQKV
jgi:hypothetical protein